MLLLPEDLLLNMDRVRIIMYVSFSFTQLDLSRTRRGCSPRSCMYRNRKKVLIFPFIYYLFEDLFA